MPELAPAGDDHRDTEAVRGRHHLGVADRAARLDDRGHARGRRLLHPVGKGKEGVGGEGGARRVVALGAGLVFLPPCFVLATLPPYLIRVASRAVTHVGRVSGSVYGAGSAGSIAGVFISGYVLIDFLNLSHIFWCTGALILSLGMVCWFWNPPIDDPVAHPPTHAL